MTRRILGAQVVTPRVRLRLVRIDDAPLPLPGVRRRGFAARVAVTLAVGVVLVVAAMVTR